MIQRIQSVYLLIASVLVFLVLRLQLAFFSGEAIFAEFYASGIYLLDGVKLQSTPYLMTIGVLAAILPIAIIFFYHKRMLQLRLCIALTALQLGILVIGGAYYYLAVRSFGELGCEVFTLRPICFAPVVSIILTLMAARAIFKDELLIRSLDRIR